MSEKPNTPEAKDELTDEQLDEVNGGIIIIGGRSAFVPAVQFNALSPLLGGPDTKQGG